jgi:hypothetical protein
VSTLVSPADLQRSPDEDAAIHPVVGGSPAAGFEVAAISVDPPSWPWEGDIDDLVSLEVADTAPVSVTGATSDVVATTTLDCPAASSSSAIRRSPSPIPSGP